MPVARFQLEDGRVARFEVPEGTSPEQATSLITQSLTDNPNMLDPPIPNGEAAPLVPVEREVLPPLEPPSPTLEETLSKASDVVKEQYGRFKDLAAKIADANLPVGSNPNFLVPKAEPTDSSNARKAYDKVKEVVHTIADANLPVGSNPNFLVPPELVSEAAKMTGANPQEVVNVLSAAPQDYVSDSVLTTIIPPNLRAFVAFNLFGKVNLSEKSFSAKHIEAMRAAVKTAKSKGRSAITYTDYGKETFDMYRKIREDVPEHVGYPAMYLASIIDPSYAVLTTLGRAKIYVDKEGNTHLKDTYNFSTLDAPKNNSDYNRLRDLASKNQDVKEASKGSVDINLGKVD
jgi:hypothetical protein